MNDYIDSGKASIDLPMTSYRDFVLMQAGRQFQLRRYLDHTTGSVYAGLDRLKIGKICPSISLSQTSHICNGSIGQLGISSSSHNQWVSAIDLIKAAMDSSLITGYVRQEIL